MNGDKTTSEETAFLQGIATSPEDTQLMLVYADWLEERGDQRGKLLRLIPELNTHKINSDEYRKLASRRDNLVKHYNAEWCHFVIRAALLARISVLLKANRPDYYAELRAGATNDQLDAFETQFSLTLPASFRQLYRWRNGQDENYTPIEFNRTFTFSTLEDIVRTKEISDDRIGSDFEDPEWWRRGWVPFLHNGGGSHLCVDVLAEDGGKPGQLVEFWKADADRPVKYPSLDAWLDHLASSMEDGTLKLAE